MDRQPRSKNGQPPHRTTGVLRRSCSQRYSVPPSHRSTGTPSIGDIASKSTGIVAARATQNLRVMFRSSESSSSSPAPFSALGPCRTSANSRPGSLNFRVHWTGVDDRPLWGRRPCRFQGHAALRACARFTAFDAPCTSGRSILPNAAVHRGQACEVELRAAVRPLAYRRETSGGSVHSKNRRSGYSVRRFRPVDSSTVMPQIGSIAMLYLPFSVHRTAETRTSLPTVLVSELFQGRIKTHREVR